MKKGDKVVRIISGPGSARTASLGVIAKVSKGTVQLEGDSSLKYDATTGNEIDPVFPMMYSYIVPREDV